MKNHTVGFGHINDGKDKIVIYIFSILLIVIAFMFIGCAIFMHVVLKVLNED